MLLFRIQERCHKRKILGFTLVASRLNSKVVPSFHGGCHRQYLIHKNRKIGFNMKTFGYPKSYQNSSIIEKMRRYL